MKMTLPYARAKFAEFNALYFGGELPEVPIVVTNAVSYLGKVFYKRTFRLFAPDKLDIRMRLSSYYDLPESELQDIIIHEMIHCWIAVKKLRDTSPHGRIFRSMMKDFNEKYGRNIRISYKMRRRG